MAWATSAMPGPWSRATTHKPCLVPFLTGWKRISPLLAYSTMLRATSEMAAATSVTSVPSKPNSVARERPRWRAVTMSRADVISTRVSFGMMKVPLGLPVQIGQTFLKIQCRADPFEGQAQLHHRKGHVGLDADDDRLSPAQSKHVRNGPERSRGKRINDVQHRLDAGNQVIMLFENGNVHVGLAVAIDASPGPSPHPAGRAVAACGEGWGEEPVGLHRYVLARLCGVWRRGFRVQGDLVTQKPLGFFDAPLQVTHGVHLAQVHADGHQG